jgi:outer membrane lipoprotein SlyB
LKGEQLCRQRLSIASFHKALSTGCPTHCVNDQHDLQQVSSSLKGKTMNSKIVAVTLCALALVGTAGGANAKGCIKGAAVGAVAGHYAGHHAVIGAVGGCVAGRHLANKKAADQAAAAHAAAPATQPAPAK